MSELENISNLFLLNEIFEILPQGIETLFVDQGNTLLSDGQKQRVLLARSYLCKPELILLDEPTSHLDRDRQTHVENSIIELASKVPTILVSHAISKNFINCNQIVFRAKESD